MTTHSANSDLNPHVLPSHAPARRWVRSRLTKSAAALAVVLMTGASTTAVAEAATNGSANASKTSAASTFTGHRGGHPGPGGMSASHGTPPAAAGTVESVGTGSFTLKNREGTTVIVDVTSSTTYKDRTTYKDQKVTSPSFVNITAGEMVSVEGTATSGVVTATTVTIGFGGGMWGHGRHQGAAAAGSAS